MSSIFGFGKISAAVPAAFSSPSEPRRIWAFGGGKGGIGKSFLCSNLAIAFANLGYSVTIVDLDLGGANVHTCLGSPIPKKTISDFVQRHTPSLTDLIVPAPMKGVSFISGAEDDLTIANLKSEDRQRLLRGIQQLPGDFIFLDLGAGTTNLTLDAFLMADKAITVLTPEPTSVENAYRFLKSSYYRKLRQAEEAFGLKELVDSIMNKSGPSAVRTPSDLLQQVLGQDSEKGTRLKEELSQFKPHLIVNNIRSAADANLGASMASVCRKYFGTPVEFIGAVEFDNAVWQALRKRKPLLIDSPHSRTTHNIVELARRLVGPRQTRLAG